MAGKAKKTHGHGAITLIFRLDSHGVLNECLYYHVNTTVTFSKGNADGNVYIMDHGSP